MQHADDGTLHAYLDGALTSVELGALEAHLAECDACRARLAEERALIERAHGLLARAAPPEAELPPWRHGDAVRRRPRSGPRWIPLAWAASVLVALGTGWMAHRGWEAGLTQPMVGEEAPALASRDGAGQGADDARRPARSSTAQTAAEPAAPPPSTGRAAKTTARDELADRAAQAARRPGPDRLEADQRAANRADTDRRVDAEGLAGAPAAAPAVSGAVQAVVPIDPRDVGARPSLSLDSARTLLGGELVTIPGLAVRTVRPHATLADAMVVEQELENGVVIQLIERRVALDAAQRQEYRAQERARVEAREPASELLARYLGGLRVEITGPLPADSLSRLLGRAR